MKGHRHYAVGAEAGSPTPAEQELGDRTIASTLGCESLDGHYTPGCLGFGIMLADRDSCAETQNVDHARSHSADRERGRGELEGEFPV